MFRSATHHPLATENRSSDVDLLWFPFLSAKLSFMSPVELRLFLKWKPPLSPDMHYNFPLP